MSDVRTTGTLDGDRATEPSDRAPLGPTIPAARRPPRPRWFRWTRGIVLGVVIVGLLLVLYLLTGGRSTTPLDPASTRPEGAHAIGELLKQRGVTLDRVTRYADARRSLDGGETLVVSNPDLLTDGQARGLGRAAADSDVVLLEPGDDVLNNLGVDVYPTGDALPIAREPGCELPAARRAGSIRVEGTMYAGSGTATSCYGDDSQAALVRADDGTGDGTVTAFGSPSTLTNERLADRGHAALALNMLGQHDRLVWYVPSPEDLPDGGSGDEDAMSLLIPDWLRMALVQVAVGVVLLMLAAGRRLGPVVTEPLPVVVRASETVEGRARLYRRGRARDRVADSLREAARHRVAPRLGLSTAPDRRALVAAVAERTGRPPAEVEAVLYGSIGPTNSTADSPADSTDMTSDAALVRLADDLDALEQEVRRS